MHSPKTRVCTYISVRGKLLNWFQNYLTNRAQAVVIVAKKKKKKRKRKKEHTQKTHTHICSKENSRWSTLRICAGSPIIVLIALIVNIHKPHRAQY